MSDVITTSNRTPPAVAMALNGAYWLGVFVELVKSTRELGIRHARFEGRLAFWEEVVARRDPPGELTMVE